MIVSSNGLGATGFYTVTSVNTLSPDGIYR